MKTDERKLIHRFGEYFEIRSLGDTYGLNGRYGTAKEARIEVNASNERVRALGYKPDMWMLVRVEWHRYFDENGKFVKGEELREVCEEDEDDSDL